MKGVVQVAGDPAGDAPALHPEGAIGANGGRWGHGLHGVCTNSSGA